ncbi:hypothetical protein [uncultured Brevundimonas sp.]|uniref:hypothetical protein n=1 Tax=uncultured Brevundimonas sp. TaxID=213418 RepID=UPI00263875B7|nr:hypothetical protein [uncultured Brevundimonas sp.]
MNVMSESTQTILSIVSMVAILLLWVVILLNKRRNDDWITRRLIERQEEIERQAGMNNAPPEKPEREPTGPWG